MGLSKLKKKTVLQLLLFLLGITIIFLTYFSKTIKNQNEEKSKDISRIEKFTENENKNIFENLEYKGVDKNGNKFVISSEYSDFKTENPEIINMKNLICFFYFKDGTVLEIRSKIGTYNNVTLDMSFAENVNMFYMDRSLFSDKADFKNAENRLDVEGNVKSLGPEGDLIADILSFDFIDKKLKVSMYDDSKVNVKTRLK